jgi:glutathione peroxidase
MLHFRPLALILLLLATGRPDLNAKSTEIYDFEVTTIDGVKTDLQTYRNNVLLIVNVASKCGFTDQYDGLETLFKTYSEHGFVVLGFPCNQFGNQEPGTEAQIASFCRLNYGVTFPMYAKIEVNGPTSHPLYQFLKARQPGRSEGGEIGWNFTKFLVDRNGEVVERYASSVEPESLVEDIERLLF